MEPVSLEPPGSTLKDPKSAPILSLSKKGLRSHPCAGVMLKAQVPTIIIITHIRGRKYNPTHSYP